MDTWTIQPVQFLVAEALGLKRPGTLPPPPWPGCGGEGGRGSGGGVGRGRGAEEEAARQREEASRTAWFWVLFCDTIIFSGLCLWFLLDVLVLFFPFFSFFSLCFSGSKGCGFLGRRTSEVSGLGVIF